MKRNLFFVIIAVVTFVLSSCETRDQYWEKSEFDIETNPLINTNGNFETFATVYLNDISINRARGEIIDIIIKNAWFRVQGDFTRGDDVRIYDISINGRVLPLNYALNVSSNPSGSYTFENDNEFMDFFEQSLRSLDYRNRLDIRVRGYSNMSFGTLAIDIESNLDVLIREY